ncbi:bifunctional (p)ppGpp synthetase/guanosine-3',5'-bis(diphosphate) 3'-pyrophosphohydrolase [Candidatus Cardinium sp. TP]|uniref:bifunctional (p)ppGpp synthetase/guanosine-3',5'-bis(diphosphate) 3'-pyrophosphohydrolase n=1 Tax=Candidatus Cardinium sp. TP TaxID=2961955 RepID=UPI0021AFB851|nr:bifunctional (p)ppGpp synthetase/guanosine-3',5'-bis(diphosphate) 3'-pyrophosphohydrolase [Candidatus Cardinium sp. TP]MCT4696766.1 bifunctional (p)ppGpp synthetase/guanosine-3',5'-bis(diphosphate) 3'-pyrophosphohydrolase [Candidatus Cardinium sp. TP]MDN5246772.1 bifunctional (p)ppGpp synthetase/guanosine-3',5'-bis(diphosphate) 3'-pyrophosphohydrolase [Candidatus Cardinium sp.]
MKKHEMLDLNDWNLHQLARAVSETPKAMKHTWSSIQEACSWAESFAEQTHSKMFKRSLRESIQVAVIATTEMSLGLSTVIAAILAPPFLKGLVRKEAIQSRFGLKIASILVELNRLKRCKLCRSVILNGRSAPDVAAPRILAILLQICDIIRVNYSGVPLEHLQSELLYYTSTKLLLDLKCFYIPLAHRMRLYNIQAKLADFWLKHTYSLSYYSITAKLGMTKLQRQQKLNLISEEVDSAVQAHGINFILKKRIKSIYSIWHKIQRLKVNVDQIHDLAAIRVILTGMDGKTLQEEKIACWRVLTIVSDLYSPICNIMRDWISIPRDSSYESLHLTFETYQYGRLEMQVRTERMDYIAEHGEAAHWKYKHLD